MVCSVCRYDLLMCLLLVMVCMLVLLEELMML